LKKEILGSRKLKYGVIIAVLSLTFIFLLFFILRYNTQIQGGNILDASIVKVDPYEILVQFASETNAIKNDPNLNEQSLLELELLFKEQGQPASLYIDDFDFMIYAIFGELPPDLSYIDLMREQLMSLSHINDAIFHFFMMKWFYNEYLQEINVVYPLYPLRVYETYPPDDLYGFMNSAYFKDYLELNSLDLSMISYSILPNTSLVLFYINNNEE